MALYSAITFFMLGIDMALLHFGYQHHNFLAVVPVVFCVVAAIVSFLTTFSVWLRRQAWVLGVFALLIGGIGTVIHLEIAFAHLEGLDWKILLERLIFDPRPPLAPAALAGTGLLLIMITLAEYWPIPLDGALGTGCGQPRSAVSSLGGRQRAFCSRQRAVTSGKV